MSAHEPRLARVAAMIADPARSRILAYLLDGHYAAAGELARAAGVQPSTASAHLGKLTSAGLIACEPRGRHRYFKLADADVAQALQALALVAERGAHHRAWTHPERERLREARCCYGHLAGRLGVALWAQMQREGRLVETGQGVALSAAGERWLADLGFEPAQVRAGQRLAYGCLDWSERRDHMGGSLARQLLDHFIAAGWLRRRPAGGERNGGHRVLDVTASGRRELLPRLGIEQHGKP